MDLSEVRQLKAVRKRSKPKQKTTVRTRGPAPYFRIGDYFRCKQCDGKTPIKATMTVEARLLGYRHPEDFVCDDCRKGSESNANTD